MDEVGTRIVVAYDILLTAACQLGAIEGNEFPDTARDLNKAVDLLAMIVDFSPVCNTDLRVGT